MEMVLFLQFECRECGYLTELTGGSVEDLKCGNCDSKDIIFAQSAIHDEGGNEQMENEMKFTLTLTSDEITKVSYHLLGSYRQMKKEGDEQEAAALWEILKKVHDAE